MKSTTLRFAGFSSITHAPPDETAILNFHHWLKNYRPATWTLD
jgi:hypothetical protein